LPGRTVGRALEGHARRREGASLPEGQAAVGRAEAEQRREALLPKGHVHLQLRLRVAFLETGLSKGELKRRAGDTDGAKQRIGTPPLGRRGDRGGVARGGRRAPGACQARPVRRHRGGPEGSRRGGGGRAGAAAAAGGGGGPNGADDGRRVRAEEPAGRGPRAEGMTTGGRRGGPPAAPPTSPRTDT